MNWDNIVITVVQTSGMISGACFLGKKIIEQWSLHNIEKFKHDLKVQAIKVECLQEKSANVIAELYKILVKAESEVGILLHPVRLNGSPSENDLHENARNAVNAFVIYSTENDIYLNEKECALLNEYIVEIRNICNNFRFKDMFDINKRDIWMDELKKFKEKLVPLKQELKNSFQSKIGVLTC